MLNDKRLGIPDTVPPEDRPIWRSQRLQSSVFWTPIHRAVCFGDARYVKGWLDATFDLDVDPTHVTEMVSSAHRIYQDLMQVKCGCGDWRLWFKVRLEERGYFLPGNGRGLTRISLEVDLHVGFLHLEETDEMLANLRRYDDSRDDRPVGPAGVAEPGIERTSRKLRGIDGNARRVAPTDGAEED